MAVFVLVVLVMVGFLAWRQFVNQGRCTEALGPGSSWVGGDECTPPPVRIEGLR